MEGWRRAAGARGLARAMGLGWGRSPRQPHQITWFSDILTWFSNPLTWFSNILTHDLEKKMKAQTEFTAHTNTLLCESRIDPQSGELELATWMCTLDRLEASLENTDWGSVESRG